MVLHNLAKCQPFLKNSAYSGTDLIPIVKFDQISALALLKPGSGCAVGSNC